MAAAVIALWARFAKAASRRPSPCPRQSSNERDRAALGTRIGVGLRKVAGAAANGNTRAQQNYLKELKSL
jgi:hypothetical protein